MSEHVAILRGLIDGEQDDLALTLQPIVNVLQAVDRLSTAEMASRIVAALSDAKLISPTDNRLCAFVEAVVQQTLDAGFQGIK